MFGDKIWEETNNYYMLNYRDNNFKNKEESEIIKEKKDTNMNKNDKNAPKENPN